LYSNPLNPEIHENICISLYCPDITKSAQVHIYNSKGQHIKTLLAQEPVDNFTHIYWNGNDEYGAPVPNGIYFSNVVQEKRVTHLRKIIILR